MRPIVFTKTYAPPPISERDIMRYALCCTEDEDVAALMRSALDEVRESLTYKVCYVELAVRVENGVCDFGSFQIFSRDLAKNLKGYKKAVIFGATVGTELDRLIAKYGRISPSRALMLQAIGAERIEALCDAFCSDIADGAGASFRFSPGYGDLSIDVQKDIFSLLDCQRKIGLFLSDTMMMSPSKSVTAFVGLHREK